MTRTWATISSARRLRWRPMSPVAQKEQRSAHPTWLERQNVRPRSARIETHSTRRPSPSASTSLWVSPSGVARWEATAGRPRSTSRDTSRRNASGRLVMAPGSRWCFR